MSRRSLPTKWAIALAELSGRTAVFYIFLAWMLGWMLLASLGVWYFKKDPYPFAFLLFLSNLIQLIYLPLLQIKAVEDTKQHVTQHEAHMEKLNAIHKAVDMEGLS